MRATNYKFILLILTSVLLLSCGTVHHIYKNPIDEVKVNRDQYSKIIFYNNTNLALYPSSSAIGIGIFIDGKYVTKLKWRRYIELYVEKGSHKLELYHWDVFKFTDNYNMKFDNDEYAIELYCKPVSNGYIITNQLPMDFHVNYLKIDY